MWLQVVFHASLEQLIGNDQADVSCADHQNLLAGLNSVNIHQSLNSACTVYARKVVVLKLKHLFCCACGDDGFFSGHVTILAFPLIGNNPVGINSEAVAVAQNFNIFIGSDFIAENLNDINSAGAGALALRTEESVCLLYQLTAQNFAAVHESNANTCVSGSESSAHSTRSASDY